MIKGQLVEIPANSPHYSRVLPTGMTKPEVLRRYSPHHRYSLFDGFLVGGHCGTETFQLGQRKRIGVGGKSAPLYVIGTDETENRVFVGKGHDHPGLFSKVLHFNSSQLEWLFPPQASPVVPAEGEPIEIGVAGGEHAAATLYLSDRDLFLEFEVPVPVSLTHSELELYTGDILFANIKQNL